MNKQDKLLCDLVEYIQYLDKYNKSDYWNKGYFKKIKKLLKLFCKEYTKNNWNWY